MVVFLSLNTASAVNVIQPSGILDHTSSIFKAAFGYFYDGFKEMAIRLFYLLFIINLAWKLGTLVLRQGSINDYAYEMIRGFIIYGVFMYFLQTEGWIDMVEKGIWGMVEFMQNAGLQGRPSPSGLVDYGIASADAILANIKNFSDALSGTGLFSIVVCVLVVVMMSFAAINFLIVEISISFMTFIGVFMLGFYPWDFTRNFTINYINALLGLIFKYLMIVIVAYACVTAFDLCLQDFINASEVKTEVPHVTYSFNGLTYATNTPKANVSDNTSQWYPLTSMLVVAIMTYILIDKLPNLIAGLFSGSAAATGVSAGGFARATGMTAAAGAMIMASRSMAKSVGEMTKSAAVNTVKAGGSAIGSAMDRGYTALNRKMGNADAGDVEAYKGGTFAKQMGSFFGAGLSFLGNNSSAAKHAVQSLNASGEFGKLSKGEERMASAEAAQLMKNYGMSAKEAATQAVSRTVAMGGGGGASVGSNTTNSISGVSASATAINPKLASASNKKDNDNNNSSDTAQITNNS